MPFQGVQLKNGHKEEKKIHDFSTAFISKTKILNAIHTLSYPNFREIIKHFQQFHRFAK